MQAINIIVRESFILDGSSVKNPDITVILEAPDSIMNNN